jgi:hypothetical protein
MSFSGEDYTRAHLINDIMTMTGTARGKFGLAARNYENCSTPNLQARHAEFQDIAKRVDAWREKRRLAYS